MRNLKFFLVVALCLGAISTASAQLTTGEPTSSTIRTGNRPGAGSYGLYLGATSNMFRDVFNSEVAMTSLPLINFKYMNTNQVEWRLGIEIYKSNEFIKGDIDNRSLDENGSEKITTVTSMNRYKESQAAIYPGIAYHFSPKNILDVYCGVEMPFGWEMSNVVAENSATKSASSNQKSSFFFGVGGFVGLQAFIADLPIALGFEYGIFSRFDLGLKYKSVVTTGNKTQTSYTLDPSLFKNLQIGYYDTYSKLNARRGEIGSQFRLTLSYYFK